MGLVIKSALKCDITQFKVVVMHQIHRMHEFHIENRFFGQKPKKFVGLSAELPGGIANFLG